MGKNSRERKLVKIEQTLEEKRLIEERRQARVRPYYVLTRRLLVTTTATIFLLYVGVLINHHLLDIANKLLRRGL